MNSVTAKPRTDPRHDLYSCTRAALAALLVAAGHKPAHARTLFSTLYRGELDFQALPARVAACIARGCRTELPRIAKVARSPRDGTVKLLLRLTDGLAVETVIICEQQRLTLCVSTQVGCAQRCAFCQTGRMGLWRNLTAGETVAQFLLARRWLAEQRGALRDFSRATEITNIVFMGMGEPLDNLDALIDSIAILTDPYGTALATRRIAVSTVGNPTALRRLLSVYPSLPLALSVHAADPRLRSQLVPANRRWPLTQVLQVLREQPRVKLLVQYVLLQGVNDSEEDAQRLAALLEGMAAKLNLIVYNPISDGSFTPSSPATVKKFQNFLYQRGLRAMIRFSKGSDIDAACGQLWTDVDGNLSHDSLIAKSSSSIVS